MRECACLLAAMAIAERHAAERDAALSSVHEHRGMLAELNGRASTDRETLQAEVRALAPWPALALWAWTFARRGAWRLAALL